MECFNCNNTILNTSLQIADQKINSLKNYIQKKNKKNQKNYFQNLNIDLCREILQYIIHFKGHLLIHTQKSLNKPRHMEYDSEDEISGYYWKETKNICTNCFQYGIELSLQNQKRLPFLRKDISYFMHQVENNTEFEKKKEKYYLHYLLPKYYIMDYYRQSNPHSTSCGMLVIKCN